MSPLEILSQAPSSSRFDRKDLIAWWDTIVAQPLIIPAGHTYTIQSTQLICMCYNYPGVRERLLTYSDCQAVQSIGQRAKLKFDASNVVNPVTKAIFAGFKNQF